MKLERLTLLSIACCLLLLAFAAVASAQSMDSMDSMDKMDSMMMEDEMSMMKMTTCQMLPPGIMVSSDISGIQCQPVSGGGIGNEHIEMMMPMNAVDVWGASHVMAEVCFEGAGSIKYLNAMYSPRKEMPVEYSMKDGMTCAHIERPGTVVLLPGMMAMDDMGMMDDEMAMDDMGIMDDKMAMDDMGMMDDKMAMDDMDMMDDKMAMDSMDKMDDKKMEYAMMMDSMDSMIPLEGCDVTAAYNLNFRDEPGGEKIGVVAGGTTKTAIARTPNWFKVEHNEVMGWISAHFIHGDGDCG